MGFKWVSILLLKISLVVICNGVSEHSLEMESNNFQSRETTKSIQSEDGDIIDCIDIYKQPAFNHPALVNHRIQMRPNYDSTMGTTQREGDSSITTTKQLWHKNGSCPEGTIPIRRMTSVHETKKSADFHHLDKQLEDNKEVKLLQTNHSLAILHTEGYAYYGAKGDIMVWNPPVERDDEYSTSQVALKSGPRHDYEAIESGWAVNPRTYGDRQTRFFVYWTVDGSRKTGCFDLSCPGFVQTSSEIALGAAIYPISNPTGLASEIIIYIQQDPNTSNWWVNYGEKINIGYWPAELFSLLRFHAEFVEWGGEVYSTRVGTHPHTATGMGSGHFSEYVIPLSGFIKRMRVKFSELRFPAWVNAYSDEYECYDTFYLSDYVEEPEFYYGGPGRNPRCP